MLTRSRSISHIDTHTRLQVGLPRRVAARDMKHCGNTAPPRPFGSIALKARPSATTSAVKLRDGDRLTTAPQRHAVPIHP